MSLTESLVVNGATIAGMHSLDRRRELNRLAAQKLRNRQKERAVTVKQDYFAAQSRNTQMLYDVKQLRKKKEELEKQLHAHIPVCPLGTEKDAVTPHTAGVPVIQNGGYLQYSSTPGQQPYLSPVLVLSSDGSTVVPTTTVQIVTIAPTNADYSNVPEPDLTGHPTSNGPTTTVDGVVDSDNNDKTPSDISTTASVGSGRLNAVSEALLAAVDVVKAKDVMASSVPASPVSSKPERNTRRRRSLSSVLPDTSEPPTKASKRASVRAASSDQATTRQKPAAAADNLPLSVSELTDTA